MNAKLRVGLIGLGDIAVRGHLPAIAAEERVVLTAVADTDPERLAAVAPPAAHGTEDPAAIFDDPDVDAVVIATPPSATPNLARAALTAGKWVLAEKPLGRSASEAREVGRTAGASERLQIGHTYRHHPAIERLRELIDQGALGRPLLIQNTIADEPADPHDEVALARRRRALERNSPMISDGVHACDRLNYLLGEPPEHVTGWALRSDPAFPRPNVGGGVLTYADGTVARLEVIWLYPALPPGQLVVTGPLGCAVVEPGTFELRVDFADGRSEHHPPPGDRTAVCFARQLERFVGHCLAGTPPQPGVGAAIDSLELAERVAEAAGARGAT